MTKDEALVDADKWEADIASGRATAAAGMETAMSKARATAGASGVRKGTQSWDIMMAQARQPYDSLNSTYNSEVIQLDAYRGNISAMSNTASNKAATSFTPKEGGGNDTAPGPEPGAGFEAPTSAAGQVGVGVGKAVASEVMGTVSGIGATVGAVALGAGKYAGPIGSLGATFGGAMVDPQQMEALMEDTFDMMGVDQTLGSNMKGALNLASMAMGIYGPIKGIKEVVGHMQAGTLDDAFFEMTDTVAAAFDGGMNPSDARAGRQSTRQAAENARQVDAPMPEPSMAEMNANYGVDPGMNTEAASVQAANELAAAAQHSTAAGHQAAQDAANETAATGSDAHGVDSDTSNAGFGGFGDAQQQADNPGGSGDSEGTGGGNSGGNADGSDNESGDTGGDNDGSDV